MQDRNILTNLSPSPARVITLNHVKRFKLSVLYLKSKCFVHHLVVTFVVTLQEMKINVYFILISESSPTF